MKAFTVLALAAATASALELVLQNPTQSLQRTAQNVPKVAICWSSPPCPMYKCDVPKGIPG